jgi:hypothetical protein
MPRNTSASTRFKIQIKNNDKKYPTVISGEGSAGVWANEFALQSTHLPGMRSRDDYSPKSPKTRLRVDRWLVNGPIKAIPSHVARDAF